MSKGRKALLVPALAAAALMIGGVTAGPAAAEHGNDNGSSSASLIDLSRNNILNGIQICHNNVNVLGVQVPVQDVKLALGALGGAGENTSYTSKDCIQEIEQGGKPPKPEPPKPKPPKHEKPEHEKPEHHAPEVEAEEITMPTRIDTGR